MTARAAACGRAAGMRTLVVVRRSWTPVPADDTVQVRVTQQMGDRAAARQCVPGSADPTGAVAGAGPDQAASSVPNGEGGEAGALRRPGPAGNRAPVTPARTALIPASRKGRHSGPRNALGRYPLLCERHDDTSYR